MLQNGYDARLNVCVNRYICQPQVIRECRKKFYGFLYLGKALSQLSEAHTLLDNEPTLRFLADIHDLDVGSEKQSVEIALLL